MTDKNEAWKKYKSDILNAITDYTFLFKSLAKQAPGTDGWTIALCPFHQDHNPSFAFNRSTGQWACFSNSGCGKGSPFDYLMLTENISFKESMIELGNHAGIAPPGPARASAAEKKAEARPPISDKYIKTCAGYLLANEDVHRYIQEKRGLLDTTIEKFMIGWDEKRQRNTIPIKDKDGAVVNVRLYNAKKTPKIINYTEGTHKYGSPARLYGVDELAAYQGEQVIICEGEWDRLILMQAGFMAVTGTHGAGTFRPEWAALFAGKAVAVLYDCDREGRAAVGKIVLPALATAEAASVRDVVLPLRGDKTDKDVSDYFIKRGATAADLQKLIDETPPHSYKKEEAPAEIFQLESFTEIEQEDLIDKKVCCDITVCGETSEAFHAVEKFKITFCPRLKKGECMECCSEITLPRDSQEYIGSCMSTNVQIKAMLRDYCCRYGQKPGLEITKRITVKEFFCHQKVSRIIQSRNQAGDIVQLIDGKPQELMEKRVYYLASEHPKPGNYRAVGWIKSHPKTQQITMIIESLEAQEDDYERFRVEDKAAQDHLRAFQSIGLARAVEELRENITRIYERDEILMSILLTYCSPRWLFFNQRLIRGWLVSIIMGDAGSGKTQTYQAIADFIGIGDILSGLTGSRTGLAYAIVEHPQKGWQVRIGRYPANTRKLLAVDEVQFISEEDLRTISKAMEEGFLQIDRVVTNGYESQTRLILIGNPLKDRVMDGFTFGCDALKIFPTTVVRRIDFAVMANYTDLKDLTTLNKRPEGHIKLSITADMLRAVIFWAWNLKPDQIEFEEDATTACLSRAQSLSDKFGYATQIPLVTISDMRNKLARIAAAFAVINVSAVDDFSRLVVKAEHVEAAVSFLDKLYDAENCQLNDRSAQDRAESQLTDYDEIEKVFLKKKEDAEKTYEEGNFVRCVEVLRFKDTIRRDQLAEMTGAAPDGLKRTLTILKRMNLLESGKSGYYKTPKLNRFLRLFIKAHPDYFKTGKSEFDGGGNGK